MWGFKILWILFHFFKIYFVSNLCNKKVGTINIKEEIKHWIFVAYFVYNVYVVNLRFWYFVYKTFPSCIGSSGPKSAKWNNAQKLIARCQQTHWKNIGESYTVQLIFSIQTLIKSYRLFFKRKSFSCKRYFFDLLSLASFKIKKRDFLRVFIFFKVI